MRSILDELDKLRGGEPAVIDLTNSNRYRLLVQEQNGEKTAYYFAVPIYRRRDRKLLDFRFEEVDGESRFYGSNACVTASRSVTLQNREGSCRIPMPEGYERRDGSCVCYRGVELYPTANGIACRVTPEEGNQFSFSIYTDKPFLCVKNNKKYFALMSEQFRPFMTVSCIGGEDGKGEVIAPAEITYQTKSETEFSVCVYTKESRAASILFEINLHVEKLFQDTTVESKHPNRNNAYGGTAFLGSCDSFGEQWLYTRILFSPMRDLSRAEVRSVVLYDPVFNDSALSLAAFDLSVRFCSFASNWNNKKVVGGEVARSERIDGYQRLDLTDLLTKNGKLVNKSEGVVLKGAERDGGFCVLSTGDNFYAPQILAIRYRDTQETVIGKEKP